MNIKDKLNQMTYRTSSAGVAVDNGEHDQAIEHVREVINYAESVLSDLTHPHSSMGDPS